METTIEVRPDGAGTRLDVFVAAAADVSRSRAGELIRAGAVTVNGVCAGKSLALRPGDRVTVVLPEPSEPETKPEDIPLDVVYEDGDLLVVNKPKGMVVHPAPGSESGTLVNALLWHCGESLSGIGGERRPGIVHRIDMDTSGLIIAAKNDLAHQGLASQLADHSMFRIYEAVVCGRLRADSGTVDAPIGRHPTDRKRMCVDRRGGRSAVTHWEVIARYRGYTHIRCRLETGRTHQIRVHMESIGHPLAGDLVYGRKAPEKGLAGQCLHAKELEFTHPRSGERIHLASSLPDYFVQFLSRLGEPEA